MLPLAGSRLPSSPEELVSSLQAGLRDAGIVSQETRARGEWPRLDELSINLTGARVTRAFRLSANAPASTSSVAITALSLTAEPIFFENTPLLFAMHAQAADCGFSENSDGHAVLSLQGVGAGSVFMEAAVADLEVTLKNIAQEILSKQGAEVKAVKLTLTERNSRSLGIRAEITAKAFVMTARLTVSGEIDLDDQLNLRLRDLAVSGDGMIASLASGFLRPRFAELEKRVIPLAAQSFAGIALQDVRIQCGDALRIEARFGKKE